MRWLQVFEHRRFDANYVAVFDDNKENQSRTKDTLKVPEEHINLYTYEPDSDPEELAQGRIMYWELYMQWFITDYPSRHVNIVCTRAPSVNGFLIQLYVKKVGYTAFRTSDFDWVNDLYAKWPSKRALGAMF